MPQLALGDRAIANTVAIFLKVLGDSRVE